MPRRGRKTAHPSQIEIKVPISGRIDLFQEPAPKGFPSKLLPHLSDFFVRGFNAARARFETTEVLSLADLAPETRGRPVDYAAEQEARQAAPLRAKGLTFGQIAAKVCRYRSAPGHHCNKRCADRIGKAHDSYLRREEQRRIERELTSFE